LIKLTAAAIAVLMLAGCAGNQNNGDTEDTTPQANGDVVAPGYNYDDDEYQLPYNWQTDAGFRETPMNLGGRVIRVATGQIQHFTYHADGLDHTPNETLNIMARLRDIQDEYNMTFEFSAIGPGGAVIDSVILSRLVGDASYDIINMGTNHTALDGIFTRNIVMDMKHPSIANIIDLENNPWLPETRMTYMFGRQHGVHFLVANSGQLLRTTLTFNREHAETLDLPNLYDMVWNKEWNHSNFSNIINLISQNSDQTIRPLVAERESQIGPGFVMASGGLVTESTSEGKRFVAHIDNHTLHAVTFLANMVANNQLFIDLDNAINWMAQGQAMFIAGDYENLRRFTRQEPRTDFTFGLLPMPMGDHMSDFVVSTHSSDQFYIVQDVPNPHEVAAILVAMANRTSKINIIYTELNYGVQDEDSARMLEFMLERVVVDYSRLSSARNRIGQDAMTPILNGQLAPRQAFEMIYPIVQSNYDSLLAQQ